MRGGQPGCEWQRWHGHHHHWMNEQWEGEHGDVMRYEDEAWAQRYFSFCSSIVFFIKLTSTYTIFRVYLTMTWLPQPMHNTTQWQGDDDVEDEHKNGMGGTRTRLGLKWCVLLFGSLVSFSLFISLFLVHPTNLFINIMTPMNAPMPDNWAATTPACQQWDVHNGTHLQPCEKWAQMMFIVIWAPGMFFFAYISLSVALTSFWHFCILGITWYHISRQLSVERGHIDFWGLGSM